MKHDPGVGQEDAPLVVVDEDNPRCSVANDIVTLAAQQAFGYLDAAPRTVTAPHTPVPFSRYWRTNTFPVRLRSPQRSRR